MTVSVIIPTYNRITLLPRAIDSVLMQGMPDVEVIVVDDGSTDGTEQCVYENYSDVRYVKQPNLGVSAARNIAIKQAKGEWIALLDSDDEWLEGKLTAQLSELNKTEVKVCHTQEIWVRNGVRVNQMDKHKKSGGYIFNNCLPLCAMSPSSIVIHKDVFDDVGLFDESLPACEDYDLWLRISALYEVAYLEQPYLRKYGGHEDQLSRQHWGMDRFRVIALDNLLKNTKYVEKLSKKNVDAALIMLLKKLKILLKGAVKHNNQLLITDCQTKLDYWEQSINEGEGRQLC